MQTAHGETGLTGGAGADIFVYAEGDGGGDFLTEPTVVAAADVISDFVDGEDLIGLEGLTFAELTITQDTNVVGSGTNDTIISVTVGGEILTVLDGITTTIDSNDFTVIV